MSAAGAGSKRRRGGHEEGHANHERWLLSYADFITLLMVLFVVLYSMSRADVAKFAKLQAALQRAFKVDVLKGMDSTALHGEDGWAADRTTVSEAFVQPKADARLVTTMEELREEMKRLPEAREAGSNVEVGMTRDGIVISLAGNLFFDSGRADLKPEGFVFLDTLAERLRGLPNEFRIEGHTDDTPITTTLFPSNWELSSARATTVARYLVQHGGIAPNRLMAAGLGEFRPVDTNSTREGRARNRRVDVVVMFSPVVPGSPPATGVPATAPAAAAGAAPAAANSDEHSGGHP